LAALAAATTMNLPFGTIYAFSVFLKPMESLMAIGRAEMTLVFGLAACSLTLGMNLAPLLYRIVSPGALIAIAGACSAAGLFLTACATGLPELALGYGVLFGLGGGVGFIVVQQGVNQTMQARIGLVNGYVIALYPLGAMIGAPLFGWAIAAYGLRPTLMALTLTVLAASLLSAALLRLADIRMHDASLTSPAEHDPQWPIFLRLFGVFFLAAAAGLMVALAATTVITGAIAVARLTGGWLVDHFAARHVAAGAHLFSLTGAVALSLWPTPLVAVASLAMIGMGYGVISGSTAGAIARYWHRNAFGGVASRLYIAWCVAAVSLPVLSGWLFDRTQGYATAVLIAAGGNVLGAMLSLTLPKSRNA
jgi:OFA family oxalate/formate antiporter-like MFS transporter